MMMADIPVPANTEFTKLTVDSVLSQGGERDKGCNMCHGADGNNSKPINPFGTRMFRRAGKYGSGIETGRFVMNTNDADKVPLVPKEEQPLTNTDGATLKANPQTGAQDEVLQDLKAQTLGTVCDCIEKNAKTIATQAADANIAKNIGRDTAPGGMTEGENNRNASLDTGLLLNLCTKLRDYRQGLACGKSDSDPALVCSGVSGGGKFLMDAGVSMLRFYFSGNASVVAANSLDFIDIEGSLNAYNYPTRTLIEAGQLISLNVTTFTSGDMVVTGMGTALVNGSVRNVYLNVTRSSGFLTFGIFDSDASMALLAGGHGESGRATLDFTPNAP